MSNPTVSIITPVLNGINFIEKCIQSVLNQSYPNIEHVFVDGGSTDGTVEMLSKYEARYSGRIRFISEPDRGGGDAWNKGVKMVKGEILGALNSDDVYEPSAVQTVVEFFKSNNDAYFVYGGMNYIDEKGRIVGKHEVKDLDFKELINDWCAIPTPAAFYKREVVERVGEIGMMGSDLEYWIRVAKVFQIHRIDEVLANFTVHGKSQTGAKETYKKWVRESYIVSIQHGGSILGPRSRRYYLFVINEGLRPFFDPAYPAITKLLEKLGLLMVSHKWGQLIMYSLGLSHYSTPQKLQRVLKWM